MSGFREENEFLSDAERQILEADAREEGFAFLSEEEIAELDAWYDRQAELSEGIIAEAERNAQWIDAWTEAEMMLDLV